MRTFGLRFSSVQAHETISGDFQSQTLSQVLGQLSDQQQTGVLRISGGCEVWIDGGAVYLAVTGSSNSIADVLFASGVSSQEAVAALLEADEPDAARSLVEQHPEATQALDRLLHEYNLTALFELIVPSTKTYEFEPDSTHPVGSRFAEPASELLAQAERRLQIWTKIAARIPNTGMVFAMAPVLPASGDERVISADEWRYLALLDGSRSVADLILATGESAFRVCSSLYRLLLEDLIQES